MTKVPAIVRTVTIPCTDENAAQLFHTWLLNEGVDVTGTDGRLVLVPTSNALFAWDLAEAAVSKGFAHDMEACSAVGRFIRGSS